MNNTDSTTNDITYIMPQTHKIEYCPYCGKKFPDNISDIRYCPYCGKAILGFQTIHINYWSYPIYIGEQLRDGIMHPIFIC